MRVEINTIVPNKQTFNKAYILFEDSDISKKWQNVLISERVEYVSFVWIVNRKKYYGFKMFRMKYQFLRLCLKLKEVLDEQEDDSTNYIYSDSNCVTDDTERQSTRVYTGGYSFNSQGCTT